ncbi:MAG: hypothetical protein Q9219_000602 [cf. Caloplaca sp. 3 TL-2023]
MSDMQKLTSQLEKRAIAAEEQVKLLISSIRFSVNGRTDWTEVAKDCGIVTKEAATASVASTKVTKAKAAAKKLDPKKLQEIAQMALEYAEENSLPDPQED